MRKPLATLDREDRTPEADTVRWFICRQGRPRVGPSPGEEMRPSDFASNEDQSRRRAGLRTARSQREQHYRAIRKAGLSPNSRLHLVFARRGAEQRSDNCLYDT